LADGSVPIYTALFQGGDFFSTLWATKILIEYDAKAFSQEISKAIEYLLSREKIAARRLANPVFCCLYSSGMQRMSI